MTNSLLHHLVFDCAIPWGFAWIGGAAIGKGIAWLDTRSDFGDIPLAGTVENLAKNLAICGATLVILLSLYVWQGTTPAS